MKRLSRTAWFFLVTFFARSAHALMSLPFHVDGDVGIPWLMANDWEHARTRRFFWGQDYLGTYETAVIAKLGHLIFGASGVIPLWFSVIVGQLEYSAGLALLFAAVRKFRPGFGDHLWELALAVGVLGFVPPVAEKYSFGPGMGHSLVPIATGIAVWLWTSLENPGSSPEKSARLWLCFGALLGLTVTASRLCTIPILALFACLTVGREFGKLCASVLGLAIGLFPEVLIGFEKSTHHAAKFSHPIDRWHNLANGLSQAGVSLGMIPAAILHGEDALWARGHAPVLAHPGLDLLATLTFLSFGWFTRNRLRERRSWIFPALVVVNLALIMVDGLSVDQDAARRYSLALILAVSAWVLINWENYLSRIIATLRIGMLATYLIASISYASPFGDMGKILAHAGFRADRDCLSGHGGDLTAAMALSSEVAKVVPYGGWRLEGNYSRVVEPSACPQIFHIDTGAVPFSQVYCPQPSVVYREPGAPEFRVPVTIYRCL